jgi:hypothetical protein
MTTPSTKYIVLDAPKGGRPGDRAAEAYVARKNRMQIKERKQKHPKTREIERSNNVDTFIHLHKINAKPLN